MTTKQPTVDELMAWENGELDGDADIALFQRLYDTGLGWQLQGMYGRHLSALIEAGLVKVKDGKR
jgi:hypothetical protein